MVGPPKKCAACRKVGCDGACTKPTPGKCENCKQKTLVMPITGMCGPCTFGEAETEGGNW